MKATDPINTEAEIKYQPKDGGPAFPNFSYYHGADGNVHPEATLFPGMSLRDWFAGQALVASHTVWRNVMTEQDLVRNAYRIADAMLKERDRE